MELLTWNIQCGKGVEGRVSLERIAQVVRAMGSPAVLCFQEVARHLPALDGAGADQPAELARLFPQHCPVFGPAQDFGGGPERPRQFGNLLLTTLPVLQVFRHLLPRAAHPGVRHAQRGALEVVLAAPWGPLRVVTTHLEYHSDAHRHVQVGHLRHLQEEVAMHARMEPVPGPAGGIYEARPRPVSTVLCGDFNLGPDDPLHARLCAPLEYEGAAFLDAWALARGAEPHAPTCGIGDREQWPQGPHCRDFCFVTPDLVPRVAAMDVNVETLASDHQPVRLTLRD
ncbi:MAG TPA: endonuclease/exonuclease/phosphatase family protein [bacterium]|nr:endonuclease/exonuclease/phosphatase family protein [bacterium]